MTRHDTVIAKGVNLPRVQITRETWGKVVDYWREKDGHDRRPEYLCLRAFSVCPAGIVTPLSQGLFRLYTACDGYSRIRTPSEFNALPALWVEAVDIINAERARIDSEKKT